MQNKLNSFFSKYELVLPCIIFILFMLAALPGISWGAPSLWNPDEMVWRVNSALHGELIFDETEPDWNYPSLPKYVMYGIGLIVYGLGKSEFAFIVSARIFSAFLGALGGVFVYYLARLIGMDKKFSFLASLFYVLSGIVAENGRFAHNDLYLQFFTILCVYFLIKYQQTEIKRWLYISFLFVGFATSSKYTGGSLMFLPVAVYLLMHWPEFFKKFFSIIATLVTGGSIAFIGYVIGTPKSLLNPIEYFLNILQVLRNLRSYGFNSGSSIGLIGQWAVLEGAVGIFLYYLFILSFIWFTVKWILWKAGKISTQESMLKSISIFIMALLIFDIPYIVSINYIGRYFIPFVPFFVIMASLFLKELLEIAHAKGLKFVQPVLMFICVIGIFYSALRLVSISLLFINDARIPASAYIDSMRGFGKSIEYTLYPPTIEKRKFERAHNYPIYFVEWIEDTVPTGGRFEYNLGEQGLLDRDTDYFVIDSLTYDRFYIDSICATTPVECDFFKRLVAGEVENFRLIQSFTYELPSFLPDVHVYSVNPDVFIYERVR